MKKKKIRSSARRAAGQGPAPFSPLCIFFFFSLYIVSALYREHLVRLKRTFGATKKNEWCDEKEHLVRTLREHRLTLVPDGDIIAEKAVISIETG